MPPGTVTILFTDIEGSTALATGRGDAVAREIGRVHDALVRTQLQANGGREVKALGDGLLAQFGSAREALTCAARIQQQLDRHNYANPARALKVRIGIHTGDVTAEEDDLFGEAVNAAQRIAAKASGGEVLVSDVGRRLVRQVAGCSFEDRGWHRLKGFPERWHLFELRREPDAAGAPPRTPFVPRDELQLLVQALNAVAVGEGRVFLVAGEAGVGKSRLCEEAVDEAGFRVLRGAATERGTTPYGPLAIALRDHLRQDPDVFADGGTVRRHLAALLPELGHPPAEGGREAVVAAVAHLLETVSRRSPTVLVLDDLQWADSGTLELVSSLATLARNWPLAVLCLYRSDEIPRGHPLRRLRNDLRRAGMPPELTVGPLDQAATDRLSANVLQHDLGPILRAALFDRTQGTPFFVEELATALRTSGLLTRVGDTFELDAGARIPLPATVRDVVRLRLEAMSDQAAASLQASAVIGSAVPLEVLAAIGQDASIDEVIEAGVLVESAPGLCEFRHDLVRESVYADTPWPRRRALHRTLADLLERRGAEPRLIADHWLAAGERTRAKPQLMEAGHRFARVHAARDAAAAIRAALEVWPEGDAEEARYEALHELGRCAQRCGDLAEAATAWEEAAETLDGGVEPRAMAEVKRDLANVYDLLGRVERSVAARVDAARLFEEAGLTAEAAAVRLLAVQQLFTSDPATAMSLAEAAQAAARQAGRTDLEARALALRGLILALGGQREEGTDAVRAGLSLALSEQHVDAAVAAHWVLGTIANHWADYDGAESSFDTAMELCRANNRRPGELLCLSCIAIVAYNRGEWARADEIARDVLDSQARLEVRAHAILVRGLISAGRGATKKARSLLESALAAADDPETSSTAFQAKAGLALVDELEGTGAARWAELLDVPPTALRQNYGWWLCRATTAAARRGDAAMVRRCADALAAWTSRFGGMEGVTALAHVLGEVTMLDGDPRGAAEHFGRALELMADLRSPFEVAHTRMRGGLALARAGETEAGIALLVDAYRTFRQLGARPYWTAAAADLELLGEQVDRRLGRRAAHELAHGGLTRRELDILRRVAVGRTNREIASEQFVSIRTVDMHVRNLLSKLGCRTRTEAASRAHELGLLEPVA